MRTEENWLWGLGGFAVGCGVAIAITHVWVPRRHKGTSKAKDHGPLPRDVLPSSRFSGPARASMSEQQRQVADKIAGSRSTGLRGPFRAWLVSPSLADSAQQLGLVCRYGTSLAPHESEMVILLVARYTDCPAEWGVHQPEAERAGLGAEVITALGAGRWPTLASQRQRALYELASALLRAHGQLSDGEYQAAVSCLGERAVVEVAAIVGYYMLCAITLNLFQIPP